MSGGGGGGGRVRERLDTYKYGGKAKCKYYLCHCGWRTQRANKYSLPSQGENQSTRCPTHVSPRLPFAARAGRCAAGVGLIVCRRRSKAATASGRRRRTGGDRPQAQTLAERRTGSPAQNSPLYLSLGAWHLSIFRFPFSATPNSAQRPRCTSGPGVATCCGSQYPTTPRQECPRTAR